MALHVHIHRSPARDAGWDESKHPRDGGKFASKPEGGTEGDIVYKGVTVRPNSGEHQEVTAAQFEKLQVGKVYEFGGRRGLVTGKHLPDARNARGLVTGRATVTVRWLKRAQQT